VRDLLRQARLEDEVGYLGRDLSINQAMTEANLPAAPSANSSG
jgi:hypothetical protein